MTSASWARMLDDLTSWWGSLIVLHIKHYLVYLNLKKNINLSKCACRPHYHLICNQHHRL
jgi:hypothetical protein